MSCPDPFSDREQVRLVDERRRRGWTFAQVAVALADRFGPRAWPLAKVRDFCLAPERPAPLAWHERNPDMAAFVEDRLGSFTIAEIYAEGIAVYGARVPSRSSLEAFAHRHRGFRRSPARHGAGQPAAPSVVTYGLAVAPSKAILLPRVGHGPILDALSRRDRRFADREQAEFIGALPGGTTFSAVAEACRARFGAGAWPRALIAEYVGAVMELPNGELRRMDLPKQAFIELWHEVWSPARLSAEGKAVLGDRFPGRSAVGAASRRLRAGAAKPRLAWWQRDDVADHFARKLLLAGYSVRATHALMSGAIDGPHAPSRSSLGVFRKRLFAEKPAPALRPSPPQRPSEPAIACDPAIERVRAALARLGPRHLLARPTLAERVGMMTARDAMGTWREAQRTAAFARAGLLRIGAPATCVG